MIPTGVRMTSQPRAAYLTGDGARVSDTADPTEEPRRQRLAGLTSEARMRGLQCRPVGPDDALLHVANPSSGHSTMVFAMPSWPDSWTYLWSNGGSASAADPAHAADLLAAFLDR